jgi:hypothetical protein
MFGWPLARYRLTVGQMSEYPRREVVNEVHVLLPIATDTGSSSGAAPDACNAESALLRFAAASV